MRTRTALAGLTLAFAFGAGTLPAAAAQADGARGEGAYVAPDRADDPRSSRTSGEAETAARKLNDALLWRPFFAVQLVMGVAVLPVALPIAGAAADWQDAIDICVTGPYAMLFARPLGE